MSESGTNIFTQVGIIPRKKHRSLHQKSKIPRPPNAFMIYGQEHRQFIAAQFPNECNRQISKRLGLAWRQLPKQIKEGYFLRAKYAEMEHKQKYPNYIYNPMEARKRKQLEREEQMRFAEDNINYSSSKNSEEITPKRSVSIYPKKSMVPCFYQNYVVPKKKSPNPNPMLYIDASGLQPMILGQPMEVMYPTSPNGTGYLVLPTEASFPTQGIYDIGGFLPAESTMPLFVDPTANPPTFHTVPKKEEDSPDAEDFNTVLGQAFDTLLGD